MLINCLRDALITEEIDPGDNCHARDARVNCDAHVNVKKSSYCDDEVLENIGKVGSDKDIETFDYALQTGLDLVWIDEPVLKKGNNNSSNNNNFFKDNQNLFTNIYGTGETDHGFNNFSNLEHVSFHECLKKIENCRVIIYDITSEKKQSLEALSVHKCKFLLPH
ncbi:hypothetical protein HELRODRAFT_164145 [Helobdella robusta]|uniref:Uncharacterized protein n=1 Tax=Helobdella robusta TaxID=6412 RepID=T1EV01_HELRO|nr:hypothetical protein HELRODRAFT_164145 [Helobdella robusta]ESN94324.1 hypothetical protein HELRODRAFT_164145 [Helobdella robusta]